VVIGVPLRGVRLGVLVPETAAATGAWPVPLMRGLPVGKGDEVGGLLGLMMVISGGGGLGVEEGEEEVVFVSDAILGLPGTTYTAVLECGKWANAQGKTTTGQALFYLIYGRGVDII
jgi:hypothetical protein